MKVENVRKYNDNLKLGILWIGSEDGPEPQGVICKGVKATDSMKPWKPRCRTETKHTSLVTKLRDFIDTK